MQEAHEQSSRALTTTQMVMNECHIDDENGNVQLLVGTTIFKCQRSFLVANFEYFKNELDNFKEYTTKRKHPILPPDIDATAFEEILHFLHTREIHINDSNLLQYLFVNDHLGLRTANVKEQCVAYVKSRSEESEPISNALQVFCFAFARRENVLVDVVRAHICQHLYHYSNDAQLKNISLEILKALLDFIQNFIVPPVVYGDVNLAFVYNWIKHDYGERGQYVVELTKKYVYSKTHKSPHYVPKMEYWRHRVLCEIVFKFEPSPYQRASILQSEVDFGLFNGNSRISASISFPVKKVSEWQTGEEAFSPPHIISYLSWKISFGRSGDDVSVNLHCDGTNFSPEWNCHASAVFIIKSHKEGGIDFKNEISPSLFSFNMKPCKRGPKESLKWNDLMDPEKGYIDYEGSITLDVHVRSEIPFLKTMQSYSGFGNTWPSGLRREFMDEADQRACSTIRLESKAEMGHSRMADNKIMEEAHEQYSRALTTTRMMLNQCHIDDENWDVQLLVGTTIFKCQRSFLVTNFQYFKNEFDHFEEYTTRMKQPILPPNIEATAFQKILHFIHTREIHINDSNVLQYLFVNDFLALRTGNVKEQCVAYVKSRSEESEPISNALELLCFAFARGEEVLVDIVKAHICQHLHHYSNDAQLKNVSLEPLKAILDFSRHFIVPSDGYAEINLAFIYNWVKHDYGERGPYIEELTKKYLPVKNTPIFSYHNAMELNIWTSRVGREIYHYKHDGFPFQPSSRLQAGVNFRLFAGNSRLSACILFAAEKVSEWQTGEEAFSSPSIISNLSWKTSVRRIGDDVSVNLYCDGTDSSPEWNCYASAVFIIKSHKEGGIDFKHEISLSLFSSNMKPCKWGPKECLKWNDLLDPEKGYIDYEGSISLDVHVLSEIPFLKTIQSDSGSGNTSMDCE